MNQQSLKPLLSIVMSFLLCFHVTAQCPIMDGSMINSCGVDEGPNEFIIFTTTRSNPVSAYNFYYSTSSQPSSNPTKTLAGASASIKSGTGTFSSLCCTIKPITNPSAFIPANSKVIFIPNNFDWHYNISSLCSGDTIYIAYINTSISPSNWSVSGNLGNYPATRYLQMVDVLNNCESDPRSYDQSIWPVNLDGNAVSWNNVGDPTGFNNGCDFGASGPTIDFTNPSVCLGATSANIPYTLSGCPNQYSIIWDAASISAGFSNSSSASLPISSSFNIVIPSTATIGNYSADVTITNTVSGADSTVPLTISIVGQPDFTIPANKVICSRDFVTSESFTSSTPNVTFSWTNDNTTIGLSASGIGAVPAFIAVNNGSTPQIANIVVTPSVNTCLGTAQSYTITVNPKITPTFLQVAPICKGENFTLPITSNEAVSGLWSPTINNIATTTYTFTPSATAGSCFIPATMTVEVHDIQADAGQDDNASYNSPYQLLGTGGAGNYFYSWSPSSVLNNASIPNPVAVLDEDTKFYLTVSDGTGCSAIDSVFIKVYQDSGFYVPSAFTPNGDGLNEILKIVPISISKIEYFRIFNRFGNMVFETNDISKGWGGYYKNKRQNSDTYVYVIKAFKRDGSPVLYKGSFLLIN